MDYPLHGEKQYIDGMLKEMETQIQAMRIQLRRAVFRTPRPKDAVFSASVHVRDAFRVFAGSI